MYDITFLRIAGENIGAYFTESSGKNALIECIDNSMDF